MIWETKIIVYQDVEAETYEEAFTIAEKCFKANAHYEDFEVVNAYPKISTFVQEALESGKFA